MFAAARRPAPLAPSVALLVLLGAAAGCERHEALAPPAAAAPLAVALPSGTAAFVTTTLTASAAPAGQPAGTAVPRAFRGDSVTVLGAEGGQSHVRLADGREVTLPAAGLLAAEGVAQATLLAHTKTFARPDPMAQVTAPMLEPGRLVFVLRQEGEFSEVNVDASRTTWVLSAALVDRAREVEAARQIRRARLAAEVSEPGADNALQVAREAFADTQIVKVLYATPADPNGELAASHKVDAAALVGPGPHAKAPRPQAPPPAPPAGARQPAAVP